MRNCPNCSAQIDDNAKFCVYCGTKFENKPCCPNCGSAIASGTKFCTCCGAKLISTSSNEHEEQRQREETEKAEQERIRQENLQDERRRASIAYEEKRRRDEEQEKKTTRIAIAVILFLVLAVGGGVIYCISPSISQSRTSSNKNDCQDNIELAEQNSRQNAIEIERRTAEEERPVFIGDGITFDVRGHVKSVDYINFDMDGQAYMQAEWPKIIRNKKGQIIEIDPGDPGEHPLFTYNSNGRVSKMVNLWCDDDCECSKETYTYNYDSDGFVSSYIKVKEYTHGEYCEITNPKTFTCKFTVKVIEKDSHNNWTKRKITGEDVVLDTERNSADDEYAGKYEFDEEEDAYYVKKNVEKIEKREIKYYK